MNEFFGYNIDSLTIRAFILLFSESIILLFFRRDDAGWRFRITNTLIRRWKVAASITILFVFMFFFEDAISNSIQNVINSFEYRWLLLPATLSVTFVWIWHYIVGMNINLRMVILLIIAGIIIGGFVWLNIELIQTMIQLNK